MKRQQLLLAAASTLAICLSAGTSSAFDRVNWQWDAYVNTNVDIDANIDIDIDPSGLTQVESLQVQIGDVNATSSVHDIYNNPPAGEGGPVTVDLGSITLDADYGLGGAFLPGATANGDVINGTVTSGLVDETDVPPDINGNVGATIDLGTIEVQATPGDALDAVAELPEVVSAATAVGNNANIESTVATQVHMGQLLFNLCETCESDTVPLSNESMLYLGGLTTADVTATSDVYNILNASVDSSATAVGNNISITVDPATPADAVLVADITQISLANVTANSYVHDVTVNNYTNLGAFRVGGQLDRPLINSAATAVGNNLSIKVGTIEP